MIDLHSIRRARPYVLQTGQIVLNDTADNLLANPEMRQAYLGEVE